MTLTSTGTAPSAYGFQPSDAISFVGNIVITVPLEESQTITVGEFLIVSTAGYWQSNTSNAAKIKGIALSDKTSTAAQTSGEALVSVLIWGVTEVDALVEELAAGGYDADIDVGQVIFAAGNAGTTAENGQAVVAGDGSTAITSNAMGVSLDRCDGTTSDVLYNVRIFFDGVSNVV